MKTRFQYHLDLGGELELNDWSSLVSRYNTYLTQLTHNPVVRKDIMKVLKPGRNCELKKKMQLVDPDCC